MKKLFLLSVLMLLPLLASADAVKIDGIYYNLIDNDGKAEVIKNPSYYSGSVVIPESVVYEGKTYSVTSIGHQAFDFCKDLTSVIIPNSVTTINTYAFHYCSGLTSITIPNSVKTIGNGSFSGCSDLTSITIPNSVTFIDGWAFSGCEGLTSVSLSNSVTSIGDGAFQGCSGLTSVTIPTSVHSINHYVFADCSGLTSIIIPNSVTSICRFAFSGCSGLTSIKVESDNLNYDSRNNCNAIIETSTNTLITGCKNTIIPNSVSSIGDNAFDGCSDLTFLTIPNSVTSIGDGAFQGCSGLTSIIIPNSVTFIDGWAFSGCSSLTSVNLPDNLPSIGEGAFLRCSGLSSIAIPNSVISIGDGAFKYCSGLTSLTIPNSVSSIGKLAFFLCKNLTSVMIGSGVKNIDDYAFASCKELKDVYCLAENVPNTNTDAFMDSYPEYTTLHVPANSLNAYKSTEPWSSFGKIVSLNGGETPEAKKCATPTISYGVMKLTFNCETEGVEYVYEIKDADIKKGYDSEVSLSATYEISVYATKAGYENSDVATATLVWGNASFTETTPEPSSVRALTQELAALITSSNGIITVSCEAEGQPISVYAVNGQLLGTSSIISGQTSVPTPLQPGSVAIVNIGDKSVKVLMK